MNSNMGELLKDWLQKRDISFNPKEAEWLCRDTLKLEGESLDDCLNYAYSFERGDLDEDGFMVMLCELSGMPPEELVQRIKPTTATQVGLAPIRYYIADGNIKTYKENTHVFLAPYLHEFDPNLGLRVLIGPRSSNPTGEYVRAIHMVYITVPPALNLSNTGTQQLLIGVLAHEIGHVEHPYADYPAPGPPSELDAWERGVKWASRWSALDGYRQTLRDTILDMEVGPIPEGLEEYIHGLKAILNRLEDEDQNG